VQLGFVIDHSRCIGCHACTVACKSENDVPLGNFRTWVKYTERGEFPEVRRSFAVLRCNQCTSAPCVEICPVRALEKRPDGIVDVDPDRCIGCKGCMQACPYDALYLNESSGTAEKCHFCAHRTELGLAPACAVVCPTEAIVPGDFDDPASQVSRLKAAGDLVVRKPEAGTSPNVYYREVDAAGIVPTATNAGGGYLWANQMPGPQLDSQLFEMLEKRAEARTVYDVEHPTRWGSKVAAYLFTKSLSAGAFLAGAALLTPWFGELDGLSGAPLWIPGLALLFLLITTALLIADLKRPERFLYILRYPNWGSWLTRGSVILGGYGALLALWFGICLSGVDIGALLRLALVAVTAVLALLAAVYTAWLFRQARGRVLWLSRGLTLGLALHALVAGAALLLLLSTVIGLGERSIEGLRLVLASGLTLHLFLGLGCSRFAPRGREVEYARVHRLITHGPFSRQHWLLGVLVGSVAPLALLTFPGNMPAWLAGAAAALLGLLIEESILVRAGQASPIS